MERLGLRLDLLPGPPGRGHHPAGAGRGAGPGHLPGRPPRSATTCGPSRRRRCATCARPGTWPGTPRPTRATGCRPGRAASTWPCGWPGGCARGRRQARLHAHFAHDPALVALLVHRLTGLPWSFTAHAGDLWQVPERAVADRVASAKVTVTCCRAGAEHLRELVVPELQERVRLVHRGRCGNLPPAPRGTGRSSPGRPDRLDRAAGRQRATATC